MESIFNKTLPRKFIFDDAPVLLREKQVKNQDLAIGLNLFDDIGMLDQIYFYEMSPFLYSGKYVDYKNRTKYTFRMLDMQENIVSNDVHGKFYNELKTIFERNIHLFKFLKKMLSFKPLNVYGLMRRKITDISIKQMEVNFISGKLTPFRTLILDINKNQRAFTERSLYSVIPNYSRNLFYNSFPLIRKRIKNISIFISRSKNRRSLKLFFMGFKFIVKSKRYLKSRTINRRYFKITRKRRKFTSRYFKYLVKNLLFKSLAYK